MIERNGELNMYDMIHDYKCLSVTFMHGESRTNDDHTHTDHTKLKTELQNRVNDDMHITKYRMNLIYILKLCT